jgi:hypothetical protein
LHHFGVFHPFLGSFRSAYRSWAVALLLFY